MNTLARKTGEDAECQNIVTNIHFTNKVINILSLNLKIFTRNTFTSLRNINIVFAPLVSHVTS